MNVWIGEGQGDWFEYISIPFARDEWKCIIECIDVYMHDRCIDDEGEMERNIIDRIQKNLGIE